MDLSFYVSFLTAAGLLALIPGPGVLFVLAQTSQGGKRAGLSASLGTAIGGFFHVLAGAVGLSALVYSSSLAFEVVKTLGAFYLFFLAVKAFREKRELSLKSLSEIQLQSQSLQQGIITEFLNPKTALFFLALIPQFIHPSRSVALQFFALGSVSVVFNTSVDVAVVLFSDALIAHLRRSERAASCFRYPSSAGYFVLGCLALRSSRDGV